MKFAPHVQPPLVSSAIAPSMVEQLVHALAPASEKKLLGQKSQLVPLDDFLVLGPHCLQSGFHHGPRDSS